MSVTVRISRAARASGNRVAALMNIPPKNGGIVGLRIWVGSFPLPVTVLKGALLRGFL